MAYKKISNEKWKELTENTIQIHHTNLNWLMERNEENKLFQEQTNNKINSLEETIVNLNNIIEELRQEVYTLKIINQ